MEYIFYKLLLISILVIIIFYYFNHNLNNKEYCLKEYMSIKNLPVLAQYYNNYLNNIKDLNSR